MSVLQSWLELIPIRMQSTLILGLRGPDTHAAPNVKIIGRWLRGLTFRPGNPDNVREFMYGELPLRITEKGPAAKELEFCSQHYYSHLMHALEVVAYRYPWPPTRNYAFLLFQDMCTAFHLPIETKSDFEERLKTREWARGKQPDTLEEALKSEEE
jgi:hypothetical protein